MQAPDWILCLRHGEKPPKIDGEEQEGLSPPGTRRARRLGTALGPNGRLLPRDCAAPTHIFVPSYSDPGADGTPVDTTKSHRTYLTMLPLIEQLRRAGQRNVEVVTCERDDVGSLADRVLNSGPVVVICWEHDALAAWLQRFAGKVVVNRRGEGWLPCTWDGDCFDEMWRLQLVSPTGGRRRRYEFSVVRQDRPGSRPKPLMS